MNAQDIIAHLSEDGIIAYPTEGVWGLGCLPTIHAMETLAHIKQRPHHKGYILVAHRWSLAAAYTTYRQPTAFCLENWAQGTTLLLPKSSFANDLPTCDSDKVAIRISTFRTIQMLCRLMCQPLISTSLNTHQQNTLTDHDEITEFCQKHAILQIMGTCGQAKKSSRIIDVCTKKRIR